MGLKCTWILIHLLITVSTNLLITVISPFGTLGRIMEAVMLILQERGLLL